MNCFHCKGLCRKAGRQRNGAQKWRCRDCGKYQQSTYRYSACEPGLGRLIADLVCESVSVRGIARVLRVSVQTVAARIKRAAAATPKPPIPLCRPCFEMDELRTYIGCKGNEYWVAYALCPETRHVIDFTVGKRSKRVLSTVVNTLLCSGVDLIKTDRLNIYASLIPRERHSASACGTNRIERHNLNLRTHLKRLSRRTICFSRSRAMLEACLRIYFWRSPVDRM